MTSPDLSNATDRDLNHQISQWMRSVNPSKPTRFGTIWRPNYCRDLNAVFRAESFLTDRQFRSYYERLYDLACRETPSSDMVRYKRNWISPNARRRSEALVAITQTRPIHP